MRLVANAPRLQRFLTTEVQFETGFYRAKAEHAFGCAVAEYRSIVRMAAS